MNFLAQRYHQYYIIYFLDTETFLCHSFSFFKALLNIIGGKGAISNINYYYYYFRIVFLVDGLASRCAGEGGVLCATNHIPRWRERNGVEKIIQALRVTASVSTSK